MSNTAELCARLLEHAAIHDRETSPYSPEQAAWAADLRDAAALIQAAPVVERADSATAVVERVPGNVSDNAALAAPAVPVAWHCPNDPDSATAFFWRRPSSGACPNCGKKLLPVVLAALTLPSRAPSQSCAGLRCQ